MNDAFPANHDHVSSVEIYDCISLSAFNIFVKLSNPFVEEALLFGLKHLP